MSEGLERIAQRAKAEPKCRFTALAHHLTEDFLRETWQGLNRKGAPGVDRVTVAQYAAHLDENLKELVEGMKRRYYRAPQVRRVYIPKAGNAKKLRPLGVPTIQDRLLQAAVARILSAIYEADFLDCSYGFRPGRTAHQALAALRNEVMFGGVQWVYEADIRGFFDHLDHDWLMRMLELRIGDPWILQLIRKWLSAGVLDHGQVTTPEEGTPQGGPISPVLANIYLHYALDLWFEKVVRPHSGGKATLSRFADDFVALFQNEADAKRFAQALPQRLAKFNLTLAEEKTNLLPFGRRHWRLGQSHPHHFDFLGFRHHLGTDRKGRMTVVRIPSPKSVRKFLAEVKAWLKRHMHDRPQDQQATLARKLQGFYQYFSLRLTLRKLHGVKCEVWRLWKWTLGRRSQRGARTWAQWTKHPWFILPEPKVLHPTI